ncbi:ABC transporter permease [Pseudactinotalea sp. Z1732]|uniref:ABC transporter permease n=1 Tax=Micrococcales TaxID=85006 RepID=UPI003C7E119C
MLALRWIAGRLGAAALVAWVVATVVFFALRGAGGDPTEAILGGPGSQAGPEAVAAVRTEYGLDEPVLVQYLFQLWRVATFQLGDSYARRQPVSDLIGGQLPATLILAGAALALAWVLALLIATAAVSARGRVGRLAVSVLRGVEIAASVLPHFWFGAVLIALFAVSLGWLPATSTSSAPSALVLPTITLAVPVAGFLGQVMRDGLAEAHTAPFATTSRARGASEQWVLVRHSLRHAALPAIALSGWAFGSLLSGAVVVETLFGRPGLGRLLMEATTGQDVPLVIGSVLVVALGYVVVMTLADLAEWVLDPRLRAGSASRRARTPQTDTAVGG